MARKHRRSPRLPEFDYRQVGVYFITISTHEKQCVFGKVEHDEMVPSALGRIAEAEWQHTLGVRPYIEHDAFIVMPNHVHLLFGLWTAENGDDGTRRDRACPVHAIGTDGATPADRASPVRAIGKGGAIPADRASPVPTDPVAVTRTSSPAHSVPAIVGGYKAAVTRHARRAGLWGDGPLWQGRYHDRIVRNERERAAFHEYILDNPRRWFEDRYRP